MAVAVIVHDVGLAGVLYSPVVEPMVPHDAAQVAGTLDVNCCWVPAGHVGLRGEMVSGVVDPGAVIAS